MNICVFGAASNSINPLYVSETEKLGRLLASRGHSLVFGGGKNGLMGAIARGFRENNGYVISISPKLFNLAGVLFDDFNELFLTADLVERKEEMLKQSDGFIAVPGGTGTLDEIFEVFAHCQLGYYEKPLILYNINGYYDDLMRYLEKGCREGFIAEGTLKLCHLTDKAEEAAAILENR